MSHNTHLIDMQGRVVQTWKSDCNPGAAAYLLPNGHLLRTGQCAIRPSSAAVPAGAFQEFSWDGKLIWDYTYSSATRLPHHDVCKLPNGNVLMIVWEKKTAKDAIAAGHRPETVKQGHLLADCLLEIQPTGPTTGKIVWEWHAWDHLIQEFDPKMANHGNPAAHPERIDVNFGENTLAAIVARPEELKKLQAIGYVGGPTGKKGGCPFQADWTHINAVAYNAELDQIMLSVHEFSELWIIDHSTTTAEAASHKGGKSGKGGDLLYRWGNPRAYRAGGIKDQKLFSQHNAHWIPKGRPGAGNILIFNNGMPRVGGAPLDGGRDCVAGRCPGAVSTYDWQSLWAGQDPLELCRRSGRTFSRRSSPGRSGCPTATRSSVPAPTARCSRSRRRRRPCGSTSTR